MNKIETETSYIHINTNGVLVAEQKGNIHIYPKDFKNSIVIYKSLCRDKKLPFLLVVGEYVDFPQSSLNFNSANYQNDLFSAQAIVLTGLPQRILFNNYVKIHPCVYLEEFFLTEKKLKIGF